MKWTGVFFIFISFLLSHSALAYDWSTNPGDGSEGNPYQISEPNHLISIGSEVTLLNKHFVLTNDIVLDPNNNPNHVFTTALIAPELTNNWDCLFTGTPFSGSFNGNGYAIKNMYINTLNTSNDCLGLVGCISTGEVKNVVMKNSTIITQASWAVGCICGYNQNGKIDSCISKGFVSGTASMCYSYSLLCGENSGVIDGCNVNGKISLAGWDCDNHAGVCGYNYRGSIINCTASVTINTSNYCEDIGGICGTNKSGLVLKCNAFSILEGQYQNKTVGGICGRNEYGNVKECISIVEITGGNEYEFIGGLCGLDNGGLIDQSYADAIINVNNNGRNIGGFCGHCNSDAKINNSNTDFSITANNYNYHVGGFCGHSQYGYIKHCQASGTANFMDNNLNWSGFCGYSYGSVIESSFVDYVFIAGNNCSYIGGLTGYADESEYLNCYAKNNIECGDMSSYVGGLFGAIDGETEVSLCYSVGELSYGIDNSNIGGSVGYNFEGTVSATYFLDSFGPDNGYGTPLDDPNMMIQANFIGWDFLGESTNGENEIWRMCVDGIDYPHLSWEYAQNGDFACGDGTDIFDLQALAEHWLLTKELDPTTFSYACDANGDGVIDLLDYSVLGTNW